MAGWKARSPSDQGDARQPGAAIGAPVGGALAREEVAGARRTTQLEPNGSTPWLDGELEAQERAALALEPDKLSQHAYDAWPGREAQSHAIRQPAGLLPMPAEVCEETGAALGEFALA